MSRSFPDIVPALTDGEVRLRAHRECDLEDVVEAAGDPETLRFTSVPRPYAMEQAREFLTMIAGAWESGGARHWAVEARDARTGGPRFAGSISYRPCGDAIAEVGFGLHPWARGRGVMTRTLRLALTHAFEDDGIEVMHWRAVVGNWGSRRTAWRCGFRVEGTVRGLHGDKAGRRDDAWIGSLRKGDPMQPPTRWLSTPVLDGAGVRLRPWREDDAPAPDRVPDAAGERFVPGPVPTAQTYDGWLATQRSRAADGEAVTWCVADREADRPLGNISCFRLNAAISRGSGMLGYWLHEHARGRGVMGKALDLVVAHAFSPAESGGLGLHRLSAGTDEENAGSQRMLRRAGFVECAHERATMAHADGEPTGAVSYELLASDDREARRVTPVVPPVLETPRIRIRPWRDTDAPGPDQGPDAASLRFMPAGAQPGRDDFPEWLARKRAEMDTGEHVHWCIADAETDEMLGQIQVFSMGPTAGRFQGEVGYWLRPGARGRGVVSVAIEPVIVHAFAPVEEGGLDLTRLHAGTDLDNHASQTILRRAGFTRWGEDRQAWRRNDGTLSDGAHFELLASTDRDQARARALESRRLEGELVRLRAWRDTDVPRLRGGLSGVDGAETSDAEARDWLAHRRRRQADGALVSWCVADAGRDHAVGGLDVFDIGRPLSPGGAELGYRIHPDSRGRGLMTEALALALPHLLGDRASGGLGLRRVTARTSELNTASQEVLRTAGLRQWGTAPQAGVDPDGAPVAQLHFAVTADEDRIANAALARANRLQPVTLEGNGVRLREWRDADAERVVEACLDERTRHWLAGLPSPYSRDEALSFIHRQTSLAKAGAQVGWCVADAESDECVGSITVMGLTDQDPTSGEVGYWVHPDARGRGVMTEAVRLVVRHAFVRREGGGLGLRRLRLNAADGNDASQRVARGNGFVEVGRDRLAEPLRDGSYVDLVRFDQLAADYRAT